MKNATISIVSLSGEIIYIQKHQKGYATISTANIKSGIYFFKIETKKKVLIKKIIIE
jgi:hypothetical protein